MANTQILYLEAEKRDFYNNFLQSHPNYHLRDSDGRIDHVRRPHPDPPWHYTKTVQLQNCHFYHRVLFNVIFKQQKVPMHCQTSCWKVVVAPRNLEELMWTYLLQRQLDLPSKCGSEGNRDNSSKLWGAYWYNLTLQEGQERYKQIKALYTNADEQKGIILGCPVRLNLLTPEQAAEKGLPLEVPIILKRACTEFEQHCGPSSKWTWDEKQLEEEVHAGDAFVDDRQHFLQNEYQKGTLFMRWIHDSFRWGEDSYLKFTNGNVLFDACETYHDRPDWRPSFPEFQSMMQTDKEVEENGKERT